MNRAERRKAIKLDHKAMVMLAQKENLKAIDDVVHKYSIAVSLVVRDKLGFGRKRTQRFLRQTLDVFEAINKGYLSIADIEKTLEEELHIQFKRRLNI